MFLDLANDNTGGDDGFPGRLGAHHRPVLYLKVDYVFEVTRQSNPGV